MRRRLHGSARQVRADLPTQQACGSDAPMALEAETWPDDQLRRQKQRPPWPGGPDLPQGVLQPWRMHGSGQVRRGPLKVWGDLHDPWKQVTRVVQLAALPWYRREDKRQAARPEVPQVRQRSSA